MNNDPPLLPAEGRAALERLAPQAKPPLDPEHARRRDQHRARRKARAKQASTVRKAGTRRQRIRQRQSRKARR